jgi:hypothetical protein
VRLSEDKISHLAHLLLEGALRDGLVATSDRMKALNLTKEVLNRYARLDEEIDADVRKKLASYSRGVGEGSREWDVLYRKHFDEEMKKRWR